MNVSQMKNIVVLKDLPSNIVEEAIIILKNHNKVKKREIVESTSSSNKFEEDSTENNELAVKEAEFIIQNYLKKLENANIEKKHTNIAISKYRKMQIISAFITIISIITIIISVIQNY